jgi:hypothetical protein
MIGGDESSEGRKVGQGEAGRSLKASRRWCPHLGRVRLSEDELWFAEHLFSPFVCSAYLSPSKNSMAMGAIYHSPSPDGETEA